MKRFAALLAVFAVASSVYAIEPAKPAPAAKPKAEAKPEVELCCDPDEAPADTKAIKPAPKPDAPKKDAAKPVAKK